MYSEYENEYWFFNLVKIYLNVVYEKALLWQSSEPMANFSFGLKSLSHLWYFNYLQFLSNAFIFFRG